VRRALLALCAAVALCASSGPYAVASDPLTEIRVLRLHDVGLDRILAVTPLAGFVARAGGAALLAHAGSLDEVLAGAPGELELPVSVEDLGAGSAGLRALRGRLAELVPFIRSSQGQIWIVSDGAGATGDQLGAVVFAPFLTRGHEPRSLTSDSTRRDGVVVAEDIVPTMCAVAQRSCASGAGATMRPVDAPPPVDLLHRYAANRRMSVPIQTAAGLFVAVAGLLGVALLALRDRAPSWSTSLGAWLAIAVVPLATSLLLAGHLERLTYASVLTVAIGGTVLGCAAAALVARRAGTISALAFLGCATILAFVLEAALGWTAALTTFLGGSELDGGRFYGLPNVDIGLLLGAGVFVAYGLGGPWPGAALLGALAVLAGLPFAGANLGAAVTLGAGAGLWWALAGRREAWVVVVVALAGAAAGGAITLVANAVLPGPATHITNFVEGGGDGVVATMLHRLRTGLDLIGRNPFAILPVIGVPATLLVVLRPPAPVRASFDRHPGWRAALLAILWGGVVAYLANDTGAAALGLAFGSALGGLLFVSLRDRPWMIGAS
jgi:hypothetical protein